MKVRLYDECLSIVGQIISVMYLVVSTFSVIFGTHEPIEFAITVWLISIVMWGVFTNQRLLYTIYSQNDDKRSERSHGKR